MKNKLSIAAALIPVLGFAHPGHEHHMAEIILNPLSWMDHFLFILAISMVFAFGIWKITNKYFPMTHALLKGKILNKK